MKLSIENYADKHHQIYSDEIPMNLESLLKNNSFGSILDAGCGDGNLLRSILHKGYARVVNVSGIDLSSKRIKLIRKSFPSLKLAVDSVEDMTKISSRSVDLLISTQVIEHVDDQKMIKSMSRVMKKGGIVYLSTVYKKWFGWYPYRVNGRWLLDPTHLREYTDDKQLTDKFKKDFYLIHQEKESLNYPLVDLLLNLIHFSGRNRVSLFWKFLRFFRVPIPGYFNWELILIKK